jgi:hypothetical protein
MTIIFRDQVPVMSEAEFRALGRALDDPRGYVARFNGVSLSTLFGLDRTHRWAEVVKRTRMIGGRNVTRVTITGEGRRAYALVKAYRDQQASNAAVTVAVTTTVTAQARDPFAVVAAVNGPDLDIPF